MADPNRLRFKTGASDHGKIYEGKVSRKIGAKLTPASGALSGFKGDMRLGQWLLESKTTTDYSLSMKLEWLVKISEEAMAVSRYPALLFSFVLPTGRPRPNASTEWVAMPLSVFQELTDRR